MHLGSLGSKKQIDFKRKKRAIEAMEANNKIGDQMAKTMKFDSEIQCFEKRIQILERLKKPQSEIEALYAEYYKILTAGPDKNM